jgi:ParB family chromosome partitioning protein
MASKSTYLKKPSTAKGGEVKNNKKKGLGRGLDSLFSKSAAGAPVVENHIAADKIPIKSAVQEPVDGTIFELPILDIERSQYQPRREFKEEELKELAESIRCNGLIHPPVVRKNSSGRWELIVGERRLRAAQLLSWRKIQVVVREVDEMTAATMTATENVQREDLNPIEEAESYKILQERFDLSQQDVAEKVGKGRATVANAVRLLELPEEVRELVAKKILSAGHAKVILSLDNEKDRILLARECVESRLSVRALEKKVAARLAPPAPSRPSGKPDMSEAYVKNLVDCMRRHLGCAVRITSGMTLPNGRHTKGILEIDFFDNDDLDRVLKMIGVEVE